MWTIPLTVPYQICAFCNSVSALYIFAACDTRKIAAKPGKCCYTGVTAARAFLCTVALLNCWTATLLQCFTASLLQWCCTAALSSAAKILVCTVALLLFCYCTDAHRGKKVWPCHQWSGRMFVACHKQQTFYPTIDGMLCKIYAKNCYILQSIQCRIVKSLRSSW